MRPGAFGPDLSKWDPWHPREAMRLLEDVAAPWCVAGGWAIDLFLDAERREHDDLEIAVPRGRFGEVAAALAGYELFVPGSIGGRNWVWPFVDEDTYHQTWVREPGTGLWRLDVFREPHDGDTWICRRDALLRLPYAEVIERGPEGIPYLRPEIVLLFKAKHADEPKNEVDLTDTLAYLEPERRRWLAGALARVHPGHAWLARLP